MRFLPTSTPQRGSPFSELFSTVPAEAQAEGRGVGDSSRQWSQGWSQGVSPAHFPNGSFGCHKATRRSPGEDKIALLRVTEEKRLLYRMVKRCTDHPHPPPLHSFSNVPKKGGAKGLGNGRVSMPQPPPVSRRGGDIVRPLLTFFVPVFDSQETKVRMETKVTP